MCNALRLDDMHASLPDVKYRSPPLMIHRHRVPLFKALFVLSMHWPIHVIAITQM
jgi:hypothetical protein